MKTNNPLLEVKNLTMRFGGLTAVDDLSFTIEKNEIVGLIGPNGAGKTTVFNCVTQFYKNYEGTIHYHGEKTQDLRDIHVTNVVKQGIARTFQNIELVPDLSIINNVLIGAHKDIKTNIITHIFRLPRMKIEEKALIERAESILKFLNIHHLKDLFVMGQPYGIMKKVEIARALMAEPKLIVLDEPAAGLNDQETDELEKLIYRVRDEFGATILLIEHDMGFVMNICDRVLAINFGKFLAHDTPKNIQAHPAVQEAYLGKD